MVLCCALGAWTVLCASNWRPAYSAHLVSTSGIADERRFWVNAAGVQKPDHTADYFGGALPLGWMDKGQVGTVDPSLTVDARVPTQWEHRVGLIASAQRRQVAVVFDGLGIAGSRAPLTSIALDDIGLSYPLAGHRGNGPPRSARP